MRKRHQRAQATLGPILESSKGAQEIMKDFGTRAFSTLDTMSHHFQVSFFLFPFFSLFSYSFFLSFTLLFLHSHYRDRCVVQRLVEVVAQPPPAPVSTSPFMSDLNNLLVAKRAGELTEEEFELAKARLLK